MTIEGIEVVDKQLAGIEQRFTTTGKAMEKVGRKLSLYVTGPIVALGTASFKAAGDFDQAFRAINVTLGASAEEAAVYKQRILDISSATGKAASDVAAAYYQIVSSGYKGAESLDILEVAVKGATGGAADLASTAGALTKAMNMFSLSGADGASLAMDRFMAIVDVGLLSFEEMTHAFPIAASMAAGLGVSIEETGAALATLTKVSGSTDEAATALNATLAQLITPSVALQALYSEWGVDTGPQAIEKFGGLRNVLLEVQKATGGEVDQLAELFPNIRSIRAVLPLVSTSADEFARALDEIGNSSGRTEEALSQMTTGIGFTWDQMMTALTNSSIELGNAIASTVQPAVEKLTKGITDAVRAFSELPEPVREAIVVAAGLAAAVGPLLITFGLASQGIGAAIGLIRKITGVQWLWNAALSANPIGLVVLAVGALVTAGIVLYRNWDKVLAWFNAGLDENSRKFRAWADGIRQNADAMVTGVESAYGKVMSSIQSTADAQIASARGVRDAERSALQERIGFYRDLTKERLVELDKQAIAELAAMNPNLGERAQAYLDMVSEQDSADARRNARIEKGRIREMEQELAKDDNLSRTRKRELEDEIADYYAKHEREKAADKLYNDIKASGYETFFGEQQAEADRAFDAQQKLIQDQASTQILAYAQQLAAFKQLHVDELADTETFVAAYNAAMANVQGPNIEIPEQGEEPTFSQKIVRLMAMLGGMKVKAYQSGGPINEPTLLYGLRSQKPYAIAGERGPEVVSPAGGGGMTLNFFQGAQLAIREEADIGKIERAVTDVVSRLQYKDWQMKGRYA